MLRTLMPLFRKYNWTLNHIPRTGFPAHFQTRGTATKKRMNLRANIAPLDESFEKNSTER
jgi:hypothetical protein